MNLNSFRTWSSTVAGGAVVVAAFTVLTRLLGLVRDRMLAAQFGASDVTDAYYAAFRLPDFIFQTLVLGALSSALVPAFVRLRGRGEAEGWRLASGILTVLAVTMGALALLGIALAPQVVGLVAPGFTGEQLQLTAAMTRIIMLGVILHAGSNVASAVLQGTRRFVAFALAPLVYNVGLIFGIVALVPLLGPMGLAWGVVAGALGHLAVDFAAAWRVGWRPRWYWAWADVDVRAVWKLMLPRTFGLAANQVGTVVTTAVASGLAAGSITQLTWADSLQNVPTNVFGLPLAVASFPVLAQAAAAEDSGDFVLVLRNNLRRILFLVVPAAAMLVTLRAHVVRLVLGSGRFDWADTYHTAQLLGILVVALVANSAIALMARAFYARQETRTPVTWAVVNVAVAVAGSLLLAPRWGVEGIGVASAAGAAVQALGLAVSLHRRLNLFDSAALRSLAVILGNAVAAALAARLVLELGQPLLALRTAWGVLGQGLAAGAVGSGVYLALGLLTNSRDAALVRTFLDRYRQPLARLLRRS